MNSTVWISAVAAAAVLLFGWLVWRWWRRPAGTTHDALKSVSVFMLRDVLLPGQYPAVEDGPAALARAVDLLRNDADLRRAQGAKARAQIAARHLIPSATRTFWDAVHPLLEVRT